MKIIKNFLSCLFVAALTASAAPAFADDINVCEGTWLITIGDNDLMRAELDGEGEAFTGSVQALRFTAEHSIWGFCSTTDGNAEVEWHSDIPTPADSIYLTFTGMMEDFNKITGTVKDIEGTEFAFVAVKEEID